MAERLERTIVHGRGVFHRRLAELVVTLDGRSAEAADALRLAALLTSLRLEQGRVYLDLAEEASRETLAELLPEGERPRAPALEEWLAWLRDSPAVSVDGELERPLVLTANGRLYLRRYWDYERRLRAQLTARSRASGLEAAAVRAELDRVFEPPGEEIDWQRLAAALALYRKLAVITGGAGTGKTTTVVKILAALRQLERGARIALAAPTGKAAARLAEAIRGAKGRLTLPEAELAAIPEQASTIHRLLGVRRHSPAFRHGRDNPLPVDCLVLDEASMVDLALMCKLVEALPAEARLIMLGDPYQLAAVEAGSVLAELAEPAQDRFSAAGAAWLSEAAGYEVPVAAEEGAGPAQGFDDGPSGQGELFASNDRTPEHERFEDGPSAASGTLVDTVVRLKRTHRNEGGVLALAEAIRLGQRAEAERLLGDPAVVDASWHAADGNWLDAHLRQELLAWFSAYRNAEPAEALARLDRFRLLCAHREGALGASGVNERIERLLRRRGEITPSDWYPGRPVMITRNDYALGLYNGDVGVCLADQHGGPPRVWFAGADGPRALAPGRLPEHETVFAMTVHKSQGSEFDEVLLLLPEQRSAVVDRALLYTAVTRAKQRVRVYDPSRALAAAVGAP